jgi:hydrocephalus-inducing protein
MPDDDEIVRVTEIKPEPPYQVVPGKYTPLQVKINAVADYVKYAQEVTEIEFAPTMMFQTRIVETRVTNPSSIRIEYQWVVQKFECLRTSYAREHVPAFSVRPVSGIIEAGQSTVFSVQFAPQEVDDFRGLLVCDIPYLWQQQPLKIAVSGFSRRPLCHFNVPLSDYISGGRRHPDYTFPLPADIRAIEIFAAAVGMRTQQRFEILNPTGTAYEIQWIVLTDTSNGQMTCETATAFVPSGRKHMATFSYVPLSVKTVETVFEFQIPEHNIRVPLLVVGRIIPASAPTLPQL